MHVTPKDIVITTMTMINPFGNPFAIFSARSVISLVIYLAESVMDSVEAMEAVTVAEVTVVEINHVR
jgi:hypothetical protein